MKIKTLGPNDFCLATITGDGLEIQCVDEADCCHLSREYMTYVGMNKETGRCVSKAVEDGQPFFFSVVVCKNRHIISSSDHVGHTETKDGHRYIVITQRVGGTKSNFITGDTVLVFGYYPTDFTFLGEHESCVMTSDGLVHLEQGQFLGHKNGVLEALSTKEVLEQLSKETASRSPIYESVVISPVKTKPSRPRKGTIINNRVTGKLEIFINNEWKTIKFED